MARLARCVHTAFDCDTFEGNPEGADIWPPPSALLRTSKAASMFSEAGTKTGFLRGE